MLCDECILKLGKHMNDEARKVFTTLIENGKLSKADMKRKSGLTRALVNKGVIQLESNLFIRHKIEGRSNKYWLTKNGAKLVNLLKKEN